MNTFYFDPATNLDLGGAASRYRLNKAAILMLKYLQDNDREPTCDEQRALAHYTGWGDSNVLNPGYRDMDLRDHITEDEWDSLKASALNAHYTSLGIVRALWKGLDHLGLGNLTNIRFLDPSAGIGHFSSCMPRELHLKADVVEIELDTLTAAVLKRLHPDSTIHAAGFETVGLPKKWFDVAMSNIPFGNFRVVDNEIDVRLRSSIHDYFFAHALDVIRPGGIVAFITSRYTLDKKDNTVRKWLAERADLLAAVRLPEGTFRANAGTDVVTDVIFLRRRADGDTPSAEHVPEWVNVDMTELKNRQGEMQAAFLNQVYADHPSQMLGTPALCRGMYNDNEFTLKALEGTDVAALLEAKLLEILPPDILSDAKRTKEHSSKLIDHQAAPSLWEVPEGLDAQNRARWCLLRDIYEAAKELLAQEVRDADASTVMFQRRHLNQVYDEFKFRFGPINGKQNTRLLKGHPGLPFLRGLESDFNPALSSAKKAAIFERATVRPHHASTEVTNAREALLVTLDLFNEVNLGHIADLLHCTEDEAFKQLDGLVYRTPDDELETADEYLSGNIREKLREAEKALSLNKAFQVNVDALTAALPKPLRPTEITARLGAGWIPPDVVQSFANTLMPGLRAHVGYIAPLAAWAIQPGDRSVVGSAEAIQRWGTQRRNAVVLIEDALNAVTPQVFDEDMQGNRTLNKTETVAAQAKQQIIKDEFASWVWRDADRAERLAKIYNDNFNNLKVRTFDGSHLTLPGLNSDITLKPHQKDAVWRILQSNTLLGHKVGLGKTLVLTVAIMEMRRLGLAHKGLVVVPNHLTDQWQREALWAYPGMNVLCANKGDFSKDKRGTFLSRIATGDWDLVIVPMSSFKLLPVGAKLACEFIQKEIDVLEGYLLEMKGDRESPAAVTKQVEKTLKNFRARLEEQKRMRKDKKETITWEELGVDFFAVDEAHLFKNLFFATKMNRIAGLPNSKSERAFDMYMKVRWLIGNGGRVVFATGTPVANTLAEVYTMMRYLQYLMLEENGLAHFDAWAQMFADQVVALEMTPDGSGFRMNTSLSRFTNLPELVLMWGTALDAKAITDTDIVRPDLYNGKPITVQIPSDAAIQAFVQSLAERVDKIRSGQVDPHRDNMLKITSEGRKAALDMRLVVPGAPERPDGKINALVDVVYGIWEASTPNQGAQVVFCDLATPKGKGKNKPKEIE